VKSRLLGSSRLKRIQILCEGLAEQRAACHVCWVCRNDWDVELSFGGWDSNQPMPSAYWVIRWTSRSPAST
jgi:hypothetical protein